MHKVQRAQTVAGRWLRPLLRWTARVEAVVAGAALLLIFGLVLVQVVQRYLPQGGWAWTAELATFCLVWLTFGMLGYLTGRDGHITLQVFDRVNSRVFQRGLRVFANVLVVVISIGFVLGGVHLVFAETSRVSPALRMPLVFLYAVPLAGFVLTALRGAVALFVPGLELPEEESESAESAELGVV